MSDNSKWIEKVIDNRNILSNFLISLIFFVTGIVLLASGLVEYFPPINPYGYVISSDAGNIAIVVGCILVVLSLILYFLGTRITHESAQQIRTGVSYSDLRQYLLARIDAKVDIVNKLDVLPTPKSITNISYLLSETNSELSLLRCLRPHLLLLLEEESDDRLATEIVEIIGKIKVPNSEKILTDIFRKDYLDLKIACALALGELGTIKAKKSLEKWLESAHKLDGRLLNAINRSLRKLIIPYEYTMALKNQLFDDNISKGVRDTYIQSALEEIGTDDAIVVLKAYQRYTMEYQRYAMEGVGINIVYQQILSENKKGF